MDLIIKMFSSITPVSNGLATFLLDNLELTNLKKNTLLLREGQVCNKIYFIIEGLVRSYYILDDTEITGWFMKEGDLIISVKSFYTQTPSEEYMQAIEDCTLYSLSHEKLFEAYKLYTEFNYIGRVLTEKYYIKSEERLFALRKQKGKKRFEIFRETQPELIQRVPSKYIASYLGLNVETLSRVKHH